MSDLASLWNSLGVFAWLALAVALLIIEMMTQGLTTIWFAGGALAAFVLALLGAPVWAQIVVFLVVSLLLLVFTRPIAMKYYNNRLTKTNAESLVGQNAVVTEDIDNLKAAGRVKINGLDWKAQSVRDDVTISAGTNVTVKDIQGVKLIVEVKE